MVGGQPLNELSASVTPSNFFLSTLLLLNPATTPGHYAQLLHLDSTPGLNTRLLHPATTPGYYTRLLHLSSPSLLLVMSSTTKACDYFSCSVTFTTSSNSSKFCSNKCYTSVLARAAAKRLANTQLSAPTATEDHQPPYYLEYPSRSPTARSHDRS
jgi:hypothetical protein